MFTEILRIIPNLSDSDVSKMEKNLNKRFTNIAKKFGSGLMSIIKGGGIAGLAVTLIDKILNPLKEVQEAIDKALNKGDDLATYAKQFGTTAGNLARLQSYGKASGLDAEGIRLLLGKFQSSVATSAANPGTLTATSNFVGRKDTAEAFFEFIQAMQKLTPVQQNLVQQEVFGEKQILKASEFLHQDFNMLTKMFSKAPSTEALSNAAENLGSLSDMKDLKTAQREERDLITKARLIGPKTITDLSKGDDVEMARENKRLASFDDLKKISLAADKMAKLFEDAYLMAAPILGEVLPMLMSQITGSALDIQKSRMIRGITPGQSGKDK